MTDADPREWIAAQQEMIGAASRGPWFCDDVNGDLRVWCEDILNVERDEEGHVCNWDRPSSYAPEDLIFDKSLDTWGPGEDEQDDQMRADAEFIAHARTALPAALAALSAVLDECDQPTAPILVHTKHHLRELIAQRLAGVES